MEGEAVAAVIKVLVQNLIDHTKNEISLMRGLDKEAEKLAGSLDTIQQLLNDAESRTIPGGAVRSWLRKLEDVAFDADNVLDELNYHLLSKRIKSIKPMKEKVLPCFSSLSHIAHPRNIALKIQEINDNLEYVRKEGAELGLKERLANDVPTLPTFETDSFSHDPIFIGRDELVSKIVDVINTGTTTDERVVSIFAIVGMGGLGKTTLTRNVFNHPKIKTHFGSRLWVHVSQIFDPITLFKKILKELTSSDHDEIESSQDILENTSSDQAEDQSRQDFLKKTSFGQVDFESRQDFVKKNSHDQVEVDSRQDILKRLQKALKDKTYFLILDDVWNDDRPKWDDFINSLNGVTSVKGNAIVVTTRNIEVASTMQSLHTHELKGLPHEDCWSIIKAKTFGKEDDIPSEFEAIGRKIAIRCQGLPLAASVVGGALCNKSQEEWLSIEEKWLSHDEGVHITKILKLSFDNLSLPALKKCFACCSIFPKGSKIKSQELIEYWMAEGFLEANGSNKMEFLGDKFMKVLLHNSLLQVAERDDYGNVESCAMHDLVHDLACSISGSSDNIEGGIRVRYVNHDEEGRFPIEEAKYLRTLLFKGNVYGNMFADFEHLHVLILDDDECKRLPSSIRKLIHLRKLDISSTRIKYLPDWIGDLHQLQTLNAGTRRLRELPRNVKYLINLRHLYIKKLPLPAGIGNLTSLRTLEYFIVGDKNGCKIEELGSLNGLKGKLEISNLERVENKEEAEKASLSNKSKIFELCLTWNEDREVEATNDENVLEGLQPHSNLKKLEIEGFKGKRFPSWTQKMAIENVPQGCWVPLNKLIEIKLSNCSECEEIPMFGQLPNLKSLCLEGWTNLKSINSSFYGLVNEQTRSVFPALEKLMLVEIPKVTEWAAVESPGASDVKVFPNLQHLEISQCKQLTSFPNHSVSCLKGLIIRGTGSMLVTYILKTKSKLLTELWIEGIDDLEYLPNLLFYNNPNLLELSIRMCSNLRELPDGLDTLNSLEKLIIRNCPNLERVADIGAQQSQGSLTCLKRLEICECKALLYFPCEMVGSSLEKLELENLSSIKNLPEIIDRLPKLPRLTQLRITEVSQFMVIFYSNWLSVDVSMEGSMETVDGLLQRCNSHSLTTLGLKGREGWGNLPESIQHLTSIDWLKIENYGMEELPEWLGNLSSLRWLYLYNCKKLMRLHALRGLTSLRSLYINGCPEISIEQQSDAADSQWPNISHIPYIKIDGDRIRRRRTLVSLMNGCL